MHLREFGVVTAGLYQPRDEPVQTLTWCPWKRGKTLQGGVPRVEGLFHQCWQMPSFLASTMGRARPELEEGIRSIPAFCATFQAASRILARCASHL